MTYHLLIGATSQAEPGGADVDTGNVQLRPTAYGLVRGYEPFHDMRALLDLLRGQEVRYGATFWEAMSEATRLLGDIPIVSVILLRGDRGDDPDTESSAVRRVDGVALLAAVSAASPGRYMLNGPYIFGFPQVEVELFRPTFLEGTQPVVGFCQAIAVAAGSLSDAKTLVAEYAGDNDGFVRDFGPLEVAHPMWLDDPGLRPDQGVAWTSGKVFFGRR